MLSIDQVADLKFNYSAGSNVDYAKPTLYRWLDLRSYLIEKNYNCINEISLALLGNHSGLLITSSVPGFYEFALETFADSNEYANVINNTFSLTTLTDVLEVYRSIGLHGDRGNFDDFLWDLAVVEFSEKGSNYKQEWTIESRSIHPEHLNIDRGVVLIPNNQIGKEV